MFEFKWKLACLNMRQREIHLLYGFVWPRIINIIKEFFELFRKFLTESSTCKNPNKINVNWVTYIIILYKPLSSKIFHSTHFQEKCEMIHIILKRL